MGNDDRADTHLQLPVEIHDAIKEEDDPMWRVVSDAVQLYLGVDSDSLAALNRRIEELDDRIQEREESIQEIESARKELSDRRDRLESQIEEIRSERREYETILDDIIDSLESDPTLGVASQQSDLRTAAELKNNGVASEEAIELVCSELRTRAHERDASVSERQLRRDLTIPEETDDDSGPVLRSLQEDGEQ